VEQGASPVDDSGVAAREEASAGMHGRTRGELVNTESIVRPGST
jgi:hypothetical protein